MLSALLLQSHSTNCDHLLHTTTTCSVGGLAAPLIMHIAHGSSVRNDRLLLHMTSSQPAASSISMTKEEVRLT